MKILWKKYRIQIQFLLFIGGLVYIFYHKPDPNRRIKSCLRDFEEIKSFSVNGRIIGKFIDTKNHSYPLIYVQRPNGTFIRVNLTLDHNHVYDSLSFGDLFKKEAGEATIYYGKDSLNKSIKIDYNCDNW